MRLRLLACLAAAALGCAYQRAEVKRATHFAGMYFEGSAPAAACSDADRFRYCVYEPPHGAPFDPDTLLYFFHYGSGDERTFAGPLGRAFYAELKKHGAKPPRVVSVSFAPYWILVDQPGGRMAAPTFKEFVEDWMPRLEKELKPKRRLAWGLSQGGFTAALLGLRRPELWNALALSCPAVSAVSPFAPKKELSAYAAAHGLDADRLAYGLTLFTNRIDGSKEFEPLDVLRLASAGDSPRILIQANQSDEYGFFDGAEKFAEALRARGRSVTFSPEPGMHCVNDVAQVADFLAQ